MDLSPRWEYVADTVMGGVSRGRAAAEEVAGRPAMRLTGDVSLDNNGGFIQIAFDVGQVQAADWTGIEVDIIGNGETYEMRLRTDDLVRPWQSYRASFIAPAEWTTLRLPFVAFKAHRTDSPLDLKKLRRIGVLAIGRVFAADVAVARVSLYR